MCSKAENSSSLFLLISYVKPLICLFQVKDYEASTNKINAFTYVSKSYNFTYEFFPRKYNFKYRLWKIYVS